MPKTGAGRLGWLLLLLGALSACASSTKDQAHAASGAGGNNGTAGSGGAADSGGAQSLYFDRVGFSQGGGAALCVPRPLPVGAPGTANDGRASCLVAELAPSACDCARSGRAALRAQTLATLRQRLETSGACDGSTRPSCDSYCGCEIVQPAGVASDPSSDLYACQNEANVVAGIDGFCVIDLQRSDENGAPAPLGNAALVQSCPTGEKRLLRVVGEGYPGSNTSVFLGCTGVTLN